MKTIRKTVTTSTISFAKTVVENGEVKGIPMPPLVIMGSKVSTDKAIKLINKAYKDGQYIVTDVNITDDVYEISFDDFMAHAKKVVQPNISEG